jgi:AhpD family alkylhydroperoxidase
MTRYPHLEIPPVAAELIDAAGARPLNLYRILANAPDMLDAWLHFAYALRSRPTLSRRIRELCILRTAQLHHCAYEWRQHESMAREAGVTDAQIRSLPNWDVSNVFSSRERGALELTEMLFANKLSLNGEKHIHALFTSAEMIELILTIGFYIMVPRVLLAIDANSEGEEDAECEKAISHLGERLAQRLAGSE